MQRRGAGDIGNVDRGAMIEEKARHRQIRPEMRGTAGRGRRSCTGDEFLAKRIPLVERSEERRGAVRRWNVHVNACVEQGAYGFEIVFLNRKEKCVLAALLTH